MIVINVYYNVYCPKICIHSALLHWINSLPIPNKGIESVLFLCTWSVMQLLKQPSSVVVRSQVFNLRRALKLEGVGCRHYKNQFGYFDDFGIVFLFKFIQII